MNGRWNNRPVLLLLVVLLLAGITAQAQESSQEAAEDLPALMAISSGGAVALFFSEDWQQLDYDGLLLQHSERQITLTLTLITPESVEPENLPAWAARVAGLPENIPFYPVSYGGVSGWIAQGAGLQEAGIFSALLVLPVSDGEVALIESQSPLENISQDAPLITKMLDQMLVLPVQAVTEQHTLRLPAGWRYTETSYGLLAAERESDLVEIMQGNIPEQPALIARWVPEDALSLSPADSEAQVFEIVLDESQLRAELHREGSAGTLFLRAEALPARLLEVRALTAEDLIEHLRIFLAILASSMVS